MTTGEFETRFGAGDRWNVTGGAGFLDRSGRFRSNRQVASASWASRLLPTARVRVENVRRENEADSSGTVVGDLLRERVELGGALGFVRPGFTFWKEDREETRGADRLTGEDDQENFSERSGVPVENMTNSEFIAGGRWDGVDDVLRGVYEEASEVLGREFPYPAD